MGEYFHQSNQLLIPAGNCAVCKMQGGVVDVKDANLCLILPMPKISSHVSKSHQPSGQTSSGRLTQIDDLLSLSADQPRYRQIAER